MEYLCNLNELNMENISQFRANIVQTKKNKSSMNRYKGFVYKHSFRVLQYFFSIIFALPKKE